jgi:eukaryotic-like serine/threonine-protein kinase
MMADQKQSAEDVFSEALDLPPEQRSAYLLKACRTSPELRALVDALLSDYQRMGDFLDDPLVSKGGEQDASHRTASPNPNLTAGKKLGRYTIIEPLGAGGMGTVYRALDDKLERVVAIKILSPGVLTGEDSRRRFRKEALALAKLSHAAIAQVYDVGEQDGVDYIVMECIQGETLASKLASGPLHVKEATAIVLQIAEALEEAHERGVVHRDLKPANVMITPKGNVKVLDFGIAKLLASVPGDATISMMETGALIGTPVYMSPEQAQGQTVDARTDLWSLGVIYFECLSGKPPFRGNGSIAILHSIINDEPPQLRSSRPDLPALAGQIVSRSLRKSPDERYQSAVEVVRGAQDLLASLTTTVPVLPKVERRRGLLGLVSVVALLIATGAGYWIYHRSTKKEWAHEEATPQIENLLATKRPLAALLLLDEARRYLPEDAQLKKMDEESSRAVTVTTTPSNAVVEIQDYSTPDAPWHRLGTTPLANVRIPKGYFRWKVSRAGYHDLVAAPPILDTMKFSLNDLQQAPDGMVPVPGGRWRELIDFIGWLGPYKIPPYYMDRYEVTNRDYQKFVDNGGYEKQEYWKERFAGEGGRDFSWNDAMLKFRDTTGRPGPSNWIAGHYPQGKGDFPVSGVSWFEAAAYTVYADKQLPTLSQWFQVANPSAVAQYTVPASNISSNALAPVGTYKGVGPYGTYDMAGNVREWIANPVEPDLRFILGGSWKSPAYLYFDPEALSPYDRSEENGFRCVRNSQLLPADSTGPVERHARDFSHFKPVPDNVFHAYESLYAYQKSPLNVESGGVVAETADWREEKVTFDTAYGGERMSAYLFLPKNVRPPYQTVLFFPSARILFIPDNKNGLALGDIKFFDYVVQSGRAVMYPVYEDMYERRVKFSLPGGAQNIQLTTDWYKDAARSLDYLATRPDIDSSKLAYLGVSMGSADGIILSTLLQDRLKTSIFLDGGFFQDHPPPGGDQAEFAPRLREPVLMVNGRYDFVFSLDTAQTPLFKMLGTPEKDKRHLILDTPHDVTEQRPQLVKGVLDWLDRYLGRVNDQTHK